MAVAERVLIVGAGIAGLTAAITLHRLGIGVELVERNATCQNTGAGIALQGNAMRVLRTLGLSDAVAAAGAPIGDWTFADQDGDVLCRVDLDEAWRRTGPCIGIARGSLLTLLRDAAGMVPIGRGITVDSLCQSNQYVSVAFSNGTVKNYDLVVGADGIDSGLRALTFAATLPVYTGQTTWRSMMQTCPDRPTGLHFLLGDGCFFGVCPAGQAGAYGFGNVTGPRLHDPQSGRLERLRVRFADFGNPVRSYLAALQFDAQIHCTPIDVLEDVPWRLNRILLIGDAAHAGSPMLGQGGAMAMEDAFVLAEAMGAAPSLSAALETYVAKRCPRVAWVQRASRSLARILGLPQAERAILLRRQGAEMLIERITPLTDAP